VPSVIAAAHELHHAYDRVNNGLTNFYTSNRWYTSTINGKDVARAEIFATHFENQLRSNLGLPLIEFYGADNQSGVYEGRILLPGTRTNANIGFINNGANAAGNIIPYNY
jgi:hypothetical protein